jgi:hypothetical protein
MRSASALGSDLDDPLRLPRRGEHGRALVDVDTNRLLYINICPHLDGRDHRQCVPVVGSRDQDDIEIALGQHLAIVGVGAWSILRDLPRGD